MSFYKNWKFRSEVYRHPKYSTLNANSFTYAYPKIVLLRALNVTASFWECISRHNYYLFDIRDTVRTIQHGFVSGHIKGQKVLS